MPDPVNVRIVGDDDESITVSLPAGPALPAWEDAAAKDRAMVDLLVFARLALPSAEVHCGCNPGTGFVCLRCKVVEIVERYLPGQPDPAP